MLPLHDHHRVDAEHFNLFGNNSTSWRQHSVTHQGVLSHSFASSIPMPTFFSSRVKRLLFGILNTIWYKIPVRIENTKRKTRDCHILKLLNACKNTLFHGYARAGAGSNTIKIITYSRGQRMDKSNAVNINKHIYLVTFLHIAKKVIFIKF